MEEVAGGNTFLFEWREWLRGKQFRWDIGNCWRVYTVWFFGMAGGWREWRARRQFCLYDGNGGRVYNSVCVLGILGEYTILYGWSRKLLAMIQFCLGREHAMWREYQAGMQFFGWREWRAGIQFCLGDGNGRRKKLQAGKELCLGGGNIRQDGVAGEYSFLFRCRVCIQFSMGRGRIVGREYNSVCVEGIAGNYTILMGYREWGARVWRVEVYNSVCVKGVAGGYTTLYGGPIIRRLCNMVWVEAELAGRYTTLHGIGVVGSGGGVSLCMCKGQSGGQKKAWLLYSMTGLFHEWSYWVSFVDFIVVSICNIDVTLNFCELMRVFSSFNDCLVGGSGGAGREWRAGIQHCVWRKVYQKDLKLCMGGAGIGGAVYNSVWVEYNVAGGYTILFGSLGLALCMFSGQSGVSIQLCLGGAIGGRVFHSMCKEQCGWWVYISLFVEEGVAGSCTIFYGWKGWRAGIQLCKCGWISGSVFHYVCVKDIVTVENTTLYV
ncbi:hypothetical protein T12_15957 [Trichinella patagoniensis]|uniref:Uncharacterized protein n=1 Tax=Trichinella patagoniensis TaxID=990121 RepID=A0A0V0ZL42_9BILA|nr:hypothetical protein T12_15957 [Trichinella patagoniensis]